MKLVLPTAISICYLRRYLPYDPGLDRNTLARTGPCLGNSTKHLYSKGTKTIFCLMLTMIFCATAHRRDWLYHSWILHLFWPSQTKIKAFLVLAITTHGLVDLGITIIRYIDGTFHRRTRKGNEPFVFGLCSSECMHVATPVDCVSGHAREQWHKISA